MSIRGVGRSARVETGLGNFVVMHRRTDLLKVVGTLRPPGGHASCLHRGQE